MSCPPPPQLHASSSLALPEASRLVKLLPYMPGLPASSILAQAVFDEIVQQANRLSLFVLVSHCWSAWSQPVTSQPPASDSSLCIVPAAGGVDVGSRQAGVQLRGRAAGGAELPSMCRTL